MNPQFRIIDTGVRNGRWQISFDQALTEFHKLGRSPDTIRFLGFPPTVLIGRHQAMSHEVNVPECRKCGIALARRITGGGAIYLDQGQIGWEIVLSRERLPMPALSDYGAAICSAVAYGLTTRLAIDARFRPHSDIEVGGRKLCGTGGYFDGDTLIYQGTVLVDVDPTLVMTYLNVAEARPPMRERDSAAARIVSLKELCGGNAPSIAEVQDAIVFGLTSQLGIDAKRAEPSSEERALADKFHSEEFGTDRFTFEIDQPRGADVCEAHKQTGSGRIAAFVRLDGSADARRIREVLLTGDFFILPPRFLYDLEAALRGVSLAGIAKEIDRFFTMNQPTRSTITSEDIRAVILAATGTQPA